MAVENSAAPAELFALTPLLLLFAASGCAALIYEIVWFQLLQLVIGSSAVSLGLLLAAYMGGLCLGSAGLARVARPDGNPLRVYALLELGIAIFGIIALFGVPLVGRIYVAGPTSGFFGIVLRGVVAAGCLLPPTILMGASLPALARSLETTPQGVARIGWLYSANIAGSVFGSLYAGFYLLRVYDLGVATYTAAAINLAVAGLAYVLAGKMRHVPSGRSPESMPGRVAPHSLLVYVTIALSGLTALGAEVVWTRLLSLLLGATVYTFSIILGVFLLGLWAGSGAGSSLARRVRNPRWALAASQILLAAAIAWAAFSITRLLPYWPVDPWLSINPWFNFDLDLMRCLHTILPATLLSGASFPLALASVAAEGEDPARLSGAVYAINTLGSIVGALAFSLILIPSIGTRSSETLLIWLAAVAAVLALLSIARSGEVFAAAAGCVVVALIASATASDLPWQVIAYGRRIAPILSGEYASLDAQTQPLFVGEGINSSVVITERGDQRFFYVSGKAEASSILIDMRLQRLMGHLPTLLDRAPQSVLIVGFGAGVTAGSFVPYPDVRSITICELESLIPQASDQYFGKENDHVLRDPRTRMVYDDARHFILTTPEKFDVITTDPIHPWVKGTSTLYSKEYYELVKNHLNPGGVVAQWLPIYESDEDTVKTELATFFSVFPDATVWSNYYQGAGYDLVLIGRESASPIDVDALQQRLDQPGYSRVAASLAGAEFHSAVDLLGTYTGRASDLAPFISGATINDDLNLRLQYIAGLGLNSRRAADIYRDIMAYRRFPDDLLVGRDRRTALENSLGKPVRSF
ncbi:MAG TPA: fused MFS/spermidine synthase [Bryobacteraceae bacterium]|nr:fused MFS/spermidine synthase [Bryobacteraceae bacterium]